MRILGLLQEMTPGTRTSLVPLLIAGRIGALVPLAVQFWWSGDEDSAWGSVGGVDSAALEKAVRACPDPAGPACGMVNLPLSATELRSFGWCGVDGGPDPDVEDQLPEQVPGWGFFAVELQKLMKMYQNAGLLEDEWTVYEQGGRGWIERAAADAADGRSGNE